MNAIPSSSADAAAGFEQLVDLASARLGGVVLHASDDFFAEKENLVRDEPPVWKEGEYTDRGKWMDGWESRRRRTPGHDWCLIRLGMPGRIHGVVVDTSFFRGNYPESCWLEGTVAPADAGVDDLLGEGTAWTGVLPRSALAGDARNRFAVAVPWRFTHLRFHIDPDGGVARLRVHGEVVADPAAVAGAGPSTGAPAPLVDLAALEHGGSVVAASDMFFGGRHHLNLPGPSRGMHDGWETRRRRGPGHDWVIVRLAARGVIERAVVDTAHFKGNAPGSCTLEIADQAQATLEELVAPDFAWTPLLPMTALQPHHEHAFELVASAAGRPATHACLRIHPDGGVARLRIFGRVDETGRRALVLARLNALLPAAAEAELLACLGAEAWARAVAAARPFADERALAAASERAMEGLADEDWSAAFAAHPRIGQPRADARGWAMAEQQGAAGADSGTKEALAVANRAYEERFGHLFLTCATGKNAATILEELERRMQNDPATERRVAIDEQKKITRLRLEKLLRS
jgi:allantoicase